MKAPDPADPADRRQEELLRRYPELTWLDSSHLPPNLAAVFRPFADLAWDMADALPHNPVERDRVRRMITHLEQAKNYAVQARVGRSRYDEQTEPRQGEQITGD